MIEIAAGILLCVALIHLAWATGRCWPARDGEQLAQWVLGGEPGTKLPGRTACMGVVVALAGLALLWWWTKHDAAPALWMMGLSWLGVGVLALRGLGGFFERRFRPSIQGSPYAKMNVLLYSPLCLGLATLAASDLMR